MASGGGLPEKSPPTPTQQNNNSTKPHLVSSDYESEPEPSYPMIPNSASAQLPRSASQAELPGKMSDNTLQITLMAWVGFGCNVLGLIAAVVSFASPYWIQTYPHSFNTFKNLGLWEVCMQNYMHYKDDSQEVYNGCWWVFNMEKRYWKLRDWLLQPWLISVQVMVTGCMVVQIAAIVLAATVFLHLCPAYHHKYHQTFSLFAAAAFNLLVTVTTVIAASVFGMMSQAWDWMPRPDMNFLSWGFGFFIIAGIFALAGGICYMMDAIKSFQEIMVDEQEYNTMLAAQALETEKAMSTMSHYSYDPYNASQSYGGYAPSEKSFDTKQSYASQPTFAYDGTTYSQPSEAGGKPLDYSQGYDQGYDPQAQGYDPQAQGYDPQAQGYDPQAQGYDPQAQGYDPTQHPQEGYDPQTYGYDQQYPAESYAPQQGYEQSQPQRSHQI